MFSYDAIIRNLRSHFTEGQKKAILDQYLNFAFEHIICITEQNKIKPPENKKVMEKFFNVLIVLFTLFNV